MAICLCYPPGQILRRLNTTHSAQTSVQPRSQPHTLRSQGVIDDTFNPYRHTDTVHATDTPYDDIPAESALAYLAPIIINDLDDAPSADELAAALNTALVDTGVLASDAPALHCHRVNPTQAPTTPGIYLATATRDRVPTYSHIALPTQIPHVVRILEYVIVPDDTELYHLAMTKLHRTGKDSDLGENNDPKARIAATFGAPKPHKPASEMAMPLYAAVLRLMEYIANQDTISYSVEYDDSLVDRDNPASRFAACLELHPGHTFTPHPIRLTPEEIICALVDSCHGDVVLAGQEALLLGAFDAAVDIAIHTHRTQHALGKTTPTLVDMALHHAVHNKAARISKIAIG